MSSDRGPRGYEDFQVLLDRELTDREGDAFGHQDFAQALRSLVESPSYEPPFSVGLLGRWGTGKSSIKGIYLSSLKNDGVRDKRGRKRSDRFYPITFNAWRFGGENLKRALLRHVYLELGGQEPDLNAKLFHQIHRSTQERRLWGDFWRDAVDRWLFSTLQVIIMFVLFVGALWLVQEILPVVDDIVKGGVVAALAAVVILLGRQLLDYRRLVVTSRSNVTKVELPSSSAEEYEDLLVEQLRNLRTEKRISSVARPANAS